MILFKLGKQSKNLTDKTLPDTPYEKNIISLTLSEFMIPH